MKGAYFKRIVLFLLTNLAVLVVLSVVLQLLGIERILDEQGVGLDWRALLAFSAVLGFGGALVSLAMSKWIAKTFTGAKVIERPTTAEEQWLMDTVRALSRRVGIGMPEVAIFPSGELNAFATGARRDKALVAVSQGLLRGMRREEIEAVLGHELAHVANGDMVTLTLIQGVVNTFVIFLSRVVGFVVDRTVFRTERGHGTGFWITALVMQLLLGILASIIVMWFSRRREFRADHGSARLLGNGPMIAALNRLRSATGPTALPDSMQAMGIRHATEGSWANLFRSHPPLEARIAALQRLS